MAGGSGSSPTISVLHAYFAVVKDLRTYLTEILDPESDPEGGKTYAFFPENSDTPCYHELINTSYVAMKPAQVCQKRLKVFPPMTDMREVIDKAQEKLFKTRGVQNVITSGYRLRSSDEQRGKKDMTRFGITNYFVNTIITALQAPAWEVFLQRIGVDAMIHLLTETHFFVLLPNGCLCQMTGEPIIYKAVQTHQLPTHLRTGEPKNTPQPPARSKRKVLDPHDAERPAKRPKLGNAISRTTSSTTGAPRKTTEITPADISLVRARLFYARPARIPHTNYIVVGLPPKHVLNRLHPSYQQKPKVVPGYVDPDPRKQAEDARHLAKYVFPRQYGLSNPFRSVQQRKETFRFPDYGDREVDIKAKGSCKTPKRLKDTLCILEKMIWRHSKCRYKPLRDKACPSKIKSPGNKRLDSSIILELMSEYSSELRSQASLGDISMISAGNSILPRGLSQAERHAKNKPRFIEFACSYSEVYCYAVLVTKAVIPKTFWGSESNFKLILRHVKNFIASRRYETLSLHHILQGFSTSACEWLMPTGRAAQQQSRVSVSDALKRRELLEDFLFWYFDSFLLPLLKTTFYVTESSAFRNQVLYFRQDDWETLCAPLIDRLTTGTFEKIPESEAEELLRQRKLGFSFVRLLPKETGVRPIVNLRRRKPTQRGVYAPHERSINEILQAAFHILTYEKKTRPELLGASVFGADEVYSKLKDFKSRLLRDPSGNLPKLYFVKLDVQACFDTIEQTKLLEILRDLISEDVYMIQRYGQVTSTAGRIKRKYIKKAIPDDEHPHFLRYATELASVLRHVILVDQVTYSYSKKEEILQLLEEHITENIVKIGSDYYRQMVGIPQGSVLSGLLCSFFYGDLEKRFGKFTDDRHSVLLRLIDDYMFITTSLPKARSFLSMMEKGHPEYGCFISKDKTLTNFDYDVQVMNVTEAQQRGFPWCGYMIDMKDLSVSVDYSRYHGTNLHNSLTVDRGRRPGATFVHKMFRLAKARSHIIYCDTNLNTENVVYLNIYQNFVLSAMKMHGYIRHWGINPTKNATFIHNTVRQMIIYSHAAIHNRSSNKAGRSVVQKVAVIWLGTYAFRVVLSRKPQRYTSLLRSLSFELSLPKYQRCRKRFRSLVSDGLVSMAQIPF